MSISLSRTDKEIAGICTRHSKTVYRVCFAYMKNPADTGDAVQDTFFQLIKSGPAFESEEHERAWLIRTAANICKNILRHWRRRRENIEDLCNLPGSEKMETDDVFQAVMDLPESIKRRFIYPASTGSRSATGTFRDESGELLRIEGKIGDAAVILAQSGSPVNDVMIEGNEAASTVNGIPVTTGYYMTNPNSRGEQLAVFFASFTLGNTNAYVECSGDKSDADELSRNTAELIWQIIEEGEPCLGAPCQGGGAGTGGDFCPGRSHFCCRYSVGVTPKSLRKWSAK